MTNTSNNKKKKKRGVSIKACIVMLAVVMLLGCAIGSTVAWLISKSETVTNTFTYGNIGIELKEHEYIPVNGNGEKNKLGEKEVIENKNYKIIPGVDLPKDPFIRFTIDSEDCWLFVKVEGGNFIDKVEWKIADGWTELAGATTDGSKVYYMKVAADDQIKEENIYILKNNTIIVPETIQKEDVIETVNGVVSTKSPVNFKFTAYAIQQEGFKTAEAAWAEVSK